MQDAQSPGQTPPGQTPFGATAPTPPRSGLLAGSWAARSPWPGLSATAIAVLIVLAGMGVAVGVFVLLALAGISYMPEIEAPESSWPGGGRALLTWLGVAQTAMIALTWLVSGLRGGRRSEVLALGPPAGGPRAYLTGLAILAVVLAIYNLVLYALIGHDMLADLRPFKEMVNGPGWWLALLVIGLGAPLSEELLFRGFLQTALAHTRFGFFGAAIITTAMWTALHAGYSASGLVEVFLVGLVMCLLLWRTGSLRVTLVCHGVYNTALLLFLWAFGHLV